MRSIRPAPLLISLLALSGIAFAQPDAGQILREQQNLRPRLLPKSPELGIEPSPAPVLPGIDGTGVVKVRAFEFVGDLAELTDDELPRVVNRHVGKELSFEQLRHVANEVGQYLRNKGYSLAHAYLAAQEIEAGVVQITVLLGRVEGDAFGSGIVVNTTGTRLKLDRQLPARIDKQLVRATLARNTVAQSLYLKMAGLERGLLLLNDLPGIRARAQLDPGSEPGTTRLSVDVTEDPLISGAAWADNFGNRYTGTGRLNAQVNLNNPGGAGDQAVAQASVADGLRIGQLAYSLPVGYDGWRLGASYTDMSYMIGKEFSTLRAKGSGSVMGVNLSYPLVRSRRHSVFGGLAFDRKAMRDESQGALSANKRLQTWSLVLDGNTTDDFGAGGLTRYGFNLQIGAADLAREAGSLAADQSGPRVQGAYNKLGYNLARLQRLSANWSVFATLNGQLADKNLNSSEKFILGGVTGVRAYPSGEGLGDTGWVSSVEVRYDIAGNPTFGDWQLIAFFDTGRIEQNKNTWAGWNAGNPSQPNSYQLSGSGLGINLIKEGSHLVRAIYAHKMGSNPGRSAAGLDSDGMQDSGRIWLQTMIYF
jgi:hemolysin activation/secretion protein